MTLRVSRLLLGLTVAALPGSALAQSTVSKFASPAASTPVASTPATRTPAASVPIASTAGEVGHFKTESDATAACHGDTVVWASARSKALHLSGTRYYGKSKHGFYTCEKQALSSGYHLSGTGHHHVKQKAS